MDGDTALHKAINSKKLKLDELAREVSEVKADLDVLIAALKIVLGDKPTTGIRVLEDDEELHQVTEYVAKYGEVKETVLKSLQIVPGDCFDVNDVAEFVTQMLPGFNMETGKANISAYLKEFFEEGVIDILEKGRGQLPAKYKLKK